MMEDDKQQYLCPACEKSPEYESDITLIPPEMIEQIFQYLPLEEVFILCNKGLSGRLSCDEYFWYQIAAMHRLSIGEIFLEAAGEGYLNVVDSLLEIDNIVNYQREGGEAAGATALLEAALHGRLEIVERLLQVPGIDLNLGRGPDGNTAFMSAAWNGYPEIVDEMLKHPEIQSDINLQNENGDTALMLASIGGEYSSPEDFYQEIEEVFGRAGYPITNVLRSGVGSYRALTSKLQDQGWGNSLDEIIDELPIREGGDYWREKDFLYTRHLQVVNRLLQVPGIDVNLRNYMGITPLEAAAEEGKRRIVNRLLEDERTDDSRISPG